MEADPYIATWVLDFLLRRPLEEHILNSLLRVLPVSRYEPFFGKLLLLNMIESEVSSHSVSERTLKLLEKLEEIEFLEASGRVSDSMRRAYCAVAVDCTVRVLVNGNYRDDEVRLKYFGLVVKFWRRRLRSMEGKTENRGLCSEDLLMWKDEIEAAVLDDDICERIMKKLEDVNACEAVQAYLREEREITGPSFLELVAGAAMDDDILQKIVSVPGVAGEDTPSNKGIAKEKAHLQMISGPSLRGLDLLSTADFKRIRESIKLSSLDLQAVVKDPLADAIKIAEAISRVLNEGKCHYPAEENHVEDMSGVPGGHKYPDPEEVPVEPISAVGDVQGICNSVAVLPSPSLMQQKASASTNPSSMQQKASASTSMQQKASASTDLSLMRQNASVSTNPSLMQQKASANTSPSLMQQNASVSTNPSLVQQKASASTNPSLMQQNASASTNPSLMQQNASTRTKQSHEQHSTNASQVDPDADVGRPRLPSPRSTRVSPLKKSEDEAPKRKRRRPRRWSSLEEDTLRTAVKKFGVGNWKYILKSNEDIFFGRTEVDLKDKWRNMMR